MDYKIRITADAGTLTLSPRSVCRVLDGGLRGFDAPEGEVSLKNAAAESGGYPVTRRIRSRDLSVTFEVADGAAVSRYRDLVMRLADPCADAEIETEMWGRTRRISVIPDGAPEITYSGRGEPMRRNHDDRRTDQSAGCRRHQRRRHPERNRRCASAGLALCGTSDGACRLDCRGPERRSEAQCSRPDADEADADSSEISTFTHCNYCCNLI